MLYWRPSVPEVWLLTHVSVLSQQLRHETKRAIRQHSVLAWDGVCPTDIFDFKEFWASIYLSSKHAQYTTAFQDGTITCWRPFGFKAEAHCRSDWEHCCCQRFVTSAYTGKEEANCFTAVSDAIRTSLGPRGMDKMVCSTNYHRSPFIINVTIPDSNGQGEYSDHKWWTHNPEGNGCAASCCEDGNQRSFFRYYSRKLIPV